MSTISGTPLQAVYDYFLSQVTPDDWMTEEELEVVERDWLYFLMKAIDRFERPNIPLTIAPNGEFFVEVLGEQEIILLSRYMKLEWLARCVADWQQIEQLYSNKDFSQANHLDKLIKLHRNVELDCFKSQRRYRRSYQGKVFDFGKLAGGKKND